MSHDLAVSHDDSLTNHKLVWIRSWVYEPRLVLDQTSGMSVSRYRCSTRLDSFRGRRSNERKKVNLEMWWYR